MKEEKGKPPALRKNSKPALSKNIATQAKTVFEIPVMKSQG
jgi:hypothetical protein